MKLRDLQRQLAALLPDARAAGGESALELLSQGNDAPRLISATLLEEGLFRAQPVVGAPVPAFRAFLDGTQKTVVASYTGGGVALLSGSVAAVVRQRRDNRLYTWRAPVVETRIYAPRAHLASVTWSTLEEHYSGVLVDTTAGATDLIAHPFALRDAAIQKVRSHREQMEQRLAEQWCDAERDPLLIDGGISGSARVATSEIAVGVVKSHFTLYVHNDNLRTVLSLKHRERSSVFRIPSASRSTVASWYLRLRDPSGHDPLWGLVRAEIAIPDALEMANIGKRADEVSQWVLAEVSPLALPDSRWDKMVYGVRDCEEYLRAIA
ncbi:MAG: hypothetical protein ABJE10_12565 [bacterium]